MLTTRILNGDINVSSFINNQDYSSDRDHYNNKLLNLGTLSVINSINDSEVYEYKPDSIKELNFNIFFLRYMQDNVIDEITPYLENDFTTQVTKTKIAFGLIDGDQNPLQNGFNSVYEVRQPDNNLREPTLSGELGQTKLSTLNDKPYFVPDKIGAAAIKNPQQTGLPIFYNSYTLPFWGKKDSWIKDPLLYKNKPYFNNSFMLIEFYDSPSALSQSRVISIPIFVNSRYNIKELTNNNVLHERPCFKLKEGFDGFSFFFLNNYIKTDFYAKFSFWDAANGRKIALLPSCNDEKNKKWFQNINTFKQENNYLKYVLDYATKTYKMYEYNSTTNDFDLHRSNFDLYELAFDSYYEDVPVPNSEPYDAGVVKPITRPNNPLKFTMRNLYNNLYLGSGVSVEQTLSYDVKKTDLYDYIDKATDAELKKYNTGKFLDKINEYIKTTPNQKITNLPKSKFTYPVISNFQKQITVDGFVSHVKTFTGYSVDSELWRVRKLSLEDISVTLDNNIVFDKTYYIEAETSWDVQDKHKVSESMTLLLNAENRVMVNSDINTLIKKIMTSINFIPSLIDLINDKVTVATNNSDDTYPDYNFNLATTYLMGPILTLTNTDFLWSDHFIGYSPITITDNEGVTTTKNIYWNQLNPEVSKIKSAYSAMMANNDPKCLLIRQLVVEKLFYLKDYSYDFMAEVVKLIYNNFKVSDYPDLIREYNLYVASTNNTIPDAGQLNNLTVGGYDYIISTIADKPELRNYLFNVVVTQSGDQFITKDEKLIFTMDIIIGENIKSIVYGFERIMVTGKLKISIIDDNANIKNIFIPINTTLNAGQKPIVPKNTIKPQISGNNNTAV